MRDTISIPDTEPERVPPTLPDFATEEEMRDFWESHDSAPYWDQMEDVTNAPPADMAVGPGRAGSRARKRPPPGQMDLISLRLPAEMIDAVKAVASVRHIPYQTLMRSWIGERLAQERRGTMEARQTGKTREREDGSTTPVPSPQAIEALIERLNRNSDAMMRGRTFQEDSADTLRAMREERTAAQSTQ